MKIKNRNPKIVKVHGDIAHLKFECRKCGKIWLPSCNPGGRLSRGSWQCPKGCKAD